MYDKPVIARERIIHPAWLWSAALVLLLSVLARQGVLFLAAALLLIAELVSYAWGRHALAHVSYRRALSQLRAAWGDTVTLAVDIENRKLLPLPWIRIADEVPGALQPLSRGIGEPIRGRRLLRTLLSVLWYQRVTRRYTLVCAARGEHVFGPAELHAGDIFGLSTARLEVPVRSTLLVLPRVVPITALGLPAAQPFGDLRAPRRLFEDPLRTVGVRDYTTSDSIRHVHWKATARAGMPLVRVFEPVRTVRALLFMDVATSEEIWQGYDPDLLELAIITAASASLYLLDEGFEVGLYTNGRALLREGLVAVPPGATPGTAPAILEGLATLGPMAAAPMDRVLDHERPRMRGYDSVIAISAAPGAALCNALSRLRLDGRAPALICIGDACSAPALPGITVRRVGGEKEWRALPALTTVQALNTPGGRRL